MSKNFKAITDDITEYVGELKNAVPEAIDDFYAMVDSVTKDGVLDKKTKELIALAIGVAERCDGCIGFHTKKLQELGATREEIAETLSVTVYMGGGPALMYAAEAMRAYDQFVEANS